ncbi:MAG: hypothetical protein KKD74_00200 [Bacteroidetes bacterium]|nr:hypothetical protein [Bacteroidota bacterium]
MTTNTVFRVAGASLVLLLLLSSCVSTAKLTNALPQADAALAAGDYARALKLYEEIIASHDQAATQAQCTVYEQAGNAAALAGDQAVAESHYKLAIYYQQAGPKTYGALAKMYREAGNISKELMMLEPLEKQFPESAQAADSRKRLFELFVISEQYEHAIGLWPQLEEAEKGEVLTMQYFQANRKLNRNEACNKIAQQLLKLNGSNVDALFWEAKRYYQLGDNRYVTEMAAYEKNKTRKQYAHLLKELDVATADMKTALGYFKKLWAINPDPDYALYLTNIYARFDDEKNAAYYRQRMK